MKEWMGREGKRGGEGEKKKKRKIRVVKISSCRTSERAWLAVHVYPEALAMTRESMGAE